MKLKFTIHYATEWGQSLHVVLSYIAADGSLRTSNLAMNTSDGMVWSVETAAIQSRQQPPVAVSYRYQVEDGDGSVLRREWDVVARCYYFDVSKSYVFTDDWRDRPLNHHLYTDAYLTTAHAQHGEKVEPRRTPLYRRTLLFRVAAPQLLPGQSLALVGSHPALGQWNPARYLRMDYIGQHDWLLSVNVDAIPMPLEYKYVVVDDATHTLLEWEEGDNRVADRELQDGQVMVYHGQPLRLREQPWRIAGVVVPVFSLRSSHSFGVGDFGDLRLLVDWAVATGMKAIQLLPVNDTTTDGQWHDSHPYNIVSHFALHPHYVDLEQLGELSDPQRMTHYRRQQRELNALPQSDYEAVHRVKLGYAHELFEERGQAVLASDGYRQWYGDNREWLEPYIDWQLRQQADSVPGDVAPDSVPGDVAPDSVPDSVPGGFAAGETAGSRDFMRYLQYQLHCQLKAAADYARIKGIILKGDLPIGVARASVETATHPECYNLCANAGAMPDASAPNGQNWGFPTYAYPHDGSHDFGQSLTAAFAKRFAWMAQYFDAVRLDHVLAYFRIWEIPSTELSAQLGHFSPSIPLSAAEIEQFGLPFRRELLTQPFVNERILERLFGIHASFVRDNFLLHKAYGLYAVKADYDTQRKVESHFCGRGDENSLWIREGLYQLLSNVLFVEDQHQPDMYHPRVMAFHQPVFDALSADEQEAYMRLYNHYFYQRHNAFWGDGAMHRLDNVLGNTHMLVCAEDLGQLPPCVAPVLDAHRILSLELQTLPKQSGYEFSHLDANPVRSVATIETHDMATLRQWWEERSDRTQRYYATMLQKQGHAPDRLPPHLAEEIVARHLYCPSMLCMLSLQDWLSIDGELREKSARNERINQPADPYNRWQWRMPVTIEQLVEATRYNAKLKTMITRSKR